jgi:hypothetical protein
VKIFRRHELGCDERAMAKKTDEKRIKISEEKVTPQSDRCSNNTTLHLHPHYGREMNTSKRERERERMCVSE